MSNYQNIIGMGSTDSLTIRRIQELLILFGFVGLAVDGIYGKITKTIVKAYQSTHFDASGKPLKVDGLVGPLTYGSFYYNLNKKNPITPPLLIEVLKIARQEVGVKEEPVGSNYGPRVNEYLKCVGLGPGYSWCMAFVYFVFDKASAKLNRVNPLVKTAACMHQWDKSNGKKITSAEAIANPKLIEPGSIFIIRKKGGRGHTGIVTAVQKDYICTIEGNANAFHSSDGDGVVEQIRPINSITAGFIIHC